MYNFLRLLICHHHVFQTDEVVDTIEIYFDNLEELLYARLTNCVAQKKKTRNLLTLLPLTNENEGFLIIVDKKP